MSANTHLNVAKNEKNGEFYTKFNDIVLELSHPEYIRAFQGKSVLCNCNDGEFSNFYRVFRTLFAKLHLSKLVCVSYGTDAYAIEVTSDGEVRKELEGDGSFSSPKSLAYLKECDIVCTNPPFALFRDFFDLLIEYGKTFLVIGNKNSATCNNIFPHFMDGSVQFGFSPVGSFEHEGDEDTVSAWWYTNIPVHVPPTMPALTKSYKRNKNYYPVYDNFNAIHVPKTKDIPYDYDGLMGVPLSFLTGYDKDKFELIGESGTLAETEMFPDGSTKRKPGAFYLSGERLYSRIVIKQKMR